MAKSNSSIAWISGHQPVADFHTGLLAKVKVTSDVGGNFFWHDLDTLEETGSVSINIPTSNGVVKKVKLLDVSKKDRKMLFSTGPVMQSDYRNELWPKIQSLANGSVDKHALRSIKDRVEEFTVNFPPGKFYRNTTHFTCQLSNFLFPRLGIELPRFSFLSEYLEDYWKTDLSKALQVFGFDNFWVKVEGTRRRSLNFEDAESALAENNLIPKALPLVFISRRQGNSFISGNGQRQYELAEPSLKPLLKSTNSKSTTSLQGLPPEWHNLTQAENFRPSALLLWLLGSRFDPDQIITEEY